MPAAGAAIRLRHRSIAMRIAIAIAYAKRTAIPRSVAEKRYRAALHASLLLGAL